MTKNRSAEKTGKEIIISQTTMADLRGRQSVRATFRLSAGCINAISVMATHLGIKQKTLFDHLTEDARMIEALAEKLRDLKLSAANRIQKTYVISRRTLASLEDAAKSHNAPRDALVEVSVQRLLPLIAKERHKHQKRKKLFISIQQHFQQGRKLLEQIHTELGNDDPLSVRLGTVINAYANAYSFIEDYIEKGKIIESFDPRQMETTLDSGPPA